MNIPRRLLQVLGATLLVYWVTMFSWSLLKAFHVLPLQDPFSLVMGPEQTTLEILLFEKSLAYGPPLAFLIFLAPSIRVERVRDAGGVLIRILRIPHSAWIPLGASAAISVIILGLVLLQFLGIML